MNLELRQNGRDRLQGRSRSTRGTKEENQNRLGALQKPNGKKPKGHTSPPRPPPLGDVAHALARREWGGRGGGGIGGANELGVRSTVERPAFKA